MRSRDSGKRIVLATFGSPGDLQPFLAVGCALQCRGHDVVVATCEHYRERTIAAGLEFAAVRPDRLPGQREPDFFDRLIRQRSAPGDVFREMFLPALRESLEDTLGATAGADAVVSHTLATTARLTAEARGIAWVSAVMQPMGYLSAHEPPVLGPVWIAAALRQAGPRQTRALFGGAHRVASLWAGEWHALRRELGLPRVPDHPLWDGQHAPVRSLGLFPRVLGAPQPDWPAQARVTGFPFFQGTAGRLDPALAAFLDGGEPPIVFTLGTTAVNDPGRFYEESAEAARRLGRRAVLVVGKGRRVEAANSDNLFQIDYAPHLLLFPRALAVVHQGGIGTLSEAMLAGKPMLIMPYGHDQADNAWRANRLGVARTLPRRHYREDAVVRGLRDLLDDPRVRARTHAVADDMKREHGAERAATFIEQAVGVTPISIA